MRVIYAIVFCSFIILSCGKYKPNEFVQMEFEMPVTLLPNKDTFNFGDTLLFSISLSDTLKDAKSGNFYKMKNFQFPLFLSLEKLVDATKPFNFQQPSTHKFNYISVISNFVNTSVVATHFIPQYTSGTYKAMCKIIPKERGTFSIYVIYDIPSDDIIPDSILTLPPNSEGRKRIPFLRFPVFIFNNGNNNFNLLQKNVSDITIDKANEYRGFYTFVVK